MPALPNGQNLSNLLSQQPAKIGQKQLIFLLSVCAVLFIVVFFFINSSITSNKNKAPEPFVEKPIDYSKFTEGSAKIIKYQEDSLDKNKSYKGYIGLFGLIYADYLEHSNIDIRVQLESVAARAKNDFPAEFKQTDFIIPCLDPGCKHIEPEQEIADILKSLPDSLTGEVPKLYNKLIVLKYYEDLSKVQQISYYNDAYQSLLVVYKETNQDPKIVASLETLRKLIETKFPEQYQLYSDIKYYEIK